MTPDRAEIALLRSLKQIDEPAFGELKGELTDPDDVAAFTKVNDGVTLGPKEEAGQAAAAAPLRLSDDVSARTAIRWLTTAKSKVAQRLDALNAQRANAKRVQLGADIAQSLFNVTVGGAVAIDEFSSERSAAMAHSPFVAPLVVVFALATIVVRYLRSTDSGRDLTAEIDRLAPDGALIDLYVGDLQAARTTRNFDDEFRQRLTAARELQIRLAKVLDGSAP